MTSSPRLKPWGGCQFPNLHTISCAVISHIRLVIAYLLDLMFDIASTLLYHSTAINGIIQMLQQARYDAKVLLAMSDTQPHQSAAQTLLNELANLTNDAYTGNGTQQGCIWVHRQTSS